MLFSFVLFVLSSAPYVQIGGEAPTASPPICISKLLRKILRGLLQCLSSFYLSS